MDTPKEEVLRKMPYSELRKLARKSGITGNRKADDFITMILEKRSANEDSFDTLERKIMNSSTKNKVDQFNQDKLEASDTPRRETYEVETPKTDVAQRKEEVAVLSSSPELRPHVADVSLNVTLTRGSERKSARKPKHKVSFVTPLRKSSRLSNVGTPNQFASTKGRPKTPIPSSGKRVIRKKDEATPVLPEIVVEGPEALPTPILQIKKLEFNIGSSTKSDKKASTPYSSLRGKRRGTPTPNFNRLHQKAFDNMESIDDYSKRKVAASAKKIAEQKSLQDRIKAKKPGSKIPSKWGGIPFIPSVTSVKNIRTDFAACGKAAPAKKTAANKRAVISVSLNESRIKRTGMTASSTKGSKAISCENTPLNKKKNKFDLKASLSKKLPYKPHTGPLKPLTDFNTSLPVLPAKKENPVVSVKRAQSRSLLKGVRTNRRFELQMKNRSLLSA